MRLYNKQVLYLVFTVILLWDQKPLSQRALQIRQEGQTINDFQILQHDGGSCHQPMCFFKGTYDMLG